MFTKLLLTLAAGLAVTTLAHAQPRAQANIPFEFSVGKSVLPAGHYTFDSEVAPGVLRVRSADWKTTIVIITNGAFSRNRSEEGKIVFNRYGDSYFLSKVMYHSGGGRELQKTAREKEMAANLSVQPVKVLAVK